MMTHMHHYVYYSYEEYGRGYVGSRSCKCEPEKDALYFGSFTDKSFKPTQKIILATYETREEALKNEMILHEFYEVPENPHFANRAKQTSVGFSYIPSHDEAVKNGKKTKEMGVGIHAQTIDEKRELGLKIKEMGIGIYGISEEKRREASTKGGKIGGKISGKLTQEMGIGIHGMSEEKRKESCSRGGKIAHEMGLGVHALTKEERSAHTRRINSQKWQCTITGFITNSGALTGYQRARNIDTSNRIRLS